MKQIRIIIVVRVCHFVIQEKVIQRNLNKLADNVDVDDEEVCMRQTMKDDVVEDER